MSGYLSARYDWPVTSEASKFCVLAATYRSGSSLLALTMWETGRLGAPWEYLNYEREMDVMKSRVSAESMDDYVGKLISLRTSPNGVFSVKAHFHHFSDALDKSAALRDIAPRAKFVYIERDDKLAQAVSMAKALQSNAWMSFERGRSTPLFYSFEFIQACLDELQSQADGWWRWFEARAIKPLIVKYDDVATSPHEVTLRIADFLGVPDGGSKIVELPRIEAQRDDINTQWAERFAAELAAPTTR